jgi:hypothetical protein
LGKPTGSAIVGGLSLTFRVWELLVVTMALQAGMLPLMARDFHRIPLSAPLVNLAVVPLTGVFVPLGFLTLASGLILPAAGKLLAAPLFWLTALLLHVVQWFAHFPRWSYRIPGPPFWLIVLFFCRRHPARRGDAVEASAAENNGLGIVRGVHRLRADGWRLSLWREVDEGHAGIDGS